MNPGVAMFDFLVSIIVRRNSSQMIAEILEYAKTLTGDFQTIQPRMCSQNFEALKCLAIIETSTASGCGERQWSKLKDRTLSV